jgi:methyl-accepting chemotaxis protein
MVALEKSYAVIEFKPDGTILRANDNFLKTLGYDADEVVGKHHRMFVEPEGAASPDYVIFWADLNAGRLKSAEYQRIAREDVQTEITRELQSVAEAAASTSTEAGAAELKAWRRAAPCFECSFLPPQSQNICIN